MESRTVRMRISVFGIGYVGCVSAACFARAGHDVIGVDVNPTKAEIINRGASPIVEPQINELIRDVVKAGKLRASTDSSQAVKSTELSLVCVGTPGKPNGSLDLGHVRRVCEQIGAAVAEKSEWHTVVVRSTMLPGSLESVIQPTIESVSRKKAGKDFGLAVNPEFLREGTSIKDFYAPPFTLIGAEEEQTARIVSSLYSEIDAPVFTTSIKTAEMVKYVCNTFHALKVSFANEIGNICKALELDSHEVMNVFCADKKLSLSSYYLEPAFAFGGSCLPKDLRAVTYKAKELDVEVPLLAAIGVTNRLQVERALDMVLRTRNKRIGVLGFSFKAGTDDLRESPMVTLIEALIGKGLDLAIYDRDVSLARLVGSNREYIEREIPHIAKLMRGSIGEVLSTADTIVIGNKSEEFREIESRLRPDQTVIDLVRLFDRPSGDGYQGICW